VTQALETELQAARRTAEIKGTDAKEAREELRNLRSERGSVGKTSRALEGQVARLQKQVRLLPAASKHAIGSWSVYIVELLLLPFTPALREVRTAGNKFEERLQVDELKGQVAARDTALRQVSEAASAKERGSRAAESELHARSARLNRALEEVQRYRKLLEEAKVCSASHVYRCADLDDAA
jgi:hypothetical protein